MSELDSRDKLFENMYIFSYIFLFFTTLSKLLILPNDFINVIYLVSIAFFGTIQLLLLLFKSFSINNFVILLMAVLGMFLGAIGYQLCMLIILICNVNVIRIRRLIYADIWARVTGVFVVYMCYLMGVFGRGQTLFYRSGVLRNSLGFDSPNTFANYFFYLIVILIILINTDNSFFSVSFLKKILYTFILLISGYYICFTVTDSRSAQVTLVIISIGWVVNLFFNKKCPRPLYGIIILVMSILLSVYVVSNFDMTNSFYNELNNLTSYRLLFQHDAWIKYGGYHFLGDKSFTTGSSMPIDNLYIYILLKRGLVGLFSIIYLFFLSFKNAHKKNDFLVYIFIVSLVFKALFEATIFEFYALLPILYLFSNTERN